MGLGHEWLITKLKDVDLDDCLVGGLSPAFCNNDSVFLLLTSMLLIEQNPGRWASIAFRFKKSFSADYPPRTSLSSNYGRFSRIATYVWLQETAQ